MVGVRVLVLSLVFGASPAFAITFGEPDGDDHPSVGAIVVKFEEVPYPGFEGYLEWCTTTLIAPRVLITAAHCTLELEVAGYPEGEKDMWVSFDQGPFGDPDPLELPGKYHRVSAVITHPDYEQNPAGEWVGMENPHDVAMLVLEEPVGIAPSTLATVGFLDELRPELGRGSHSADFLAVGYGGQITYPPAEVVYFDTRWRAEMGYRGLNESWLSTSQNPHKGDGGTCYGDSGGPTFWVDAEGNETLVALTSWGDVPCVSMGFYYRTDTAEVDSFVQGVLDAVEAGEL